MESPSANLYSTAELAAAEGITERAVRLYESRGLLMPERVGVTRIYSHRDRARLGLILRGKRLGFSLADIKAYLDLYDLDPSQPSQLEWLAERVDARINQLEIQARDIVEALAELREIRSRTRAALVDTSQDTESGVSPAPGASS